MYTVSVIVVNWNGRKLLRTCLNSLREQTFGDFELIVVDNGSSDGSTEFVARNFPEARIVRNAENLGFAEGNNVGIRASNGKYIATLNNDAVADSRWLEELIRVMGWNERIGSCASKMLKYDRCDIIDSTGIKLRRTGAVEDRGSGETDMGQYETVEEIFGACAGAALYRTEMLGQVGLFPSRYFASYEDVALAWRARYAGWKCFYVPSAVVYHMRFATQKRLLAEKKSFSTQKMHNQLWYQIEYLPGRYLLRNSTGLAKLYLRLMRAGVGNRPSDVWKTIYLVPRVLIARCKYHYDKKLNKIEIYKWLEGD